MNPLGQTNTISQEPQSDGTQQGQYRNTGIDWGLELVNLKNNLISSEKYQKSDDENKKILLNDFFDRYGKKILKREGITSESEINVRKADFIDNILSGTKDKVPGNFFPTFPTAGTKGKNKEELTSQLNKKEAKQEKVTEPKPEEKTFILPSWLKTKMLLPEPLRYISLKSYTPSQKEIKEAKVPDEFLSKMPSYISDVYKSDDFGYAKKNPGYFLERGEAAVHDVDKFLRKKYDLTYFERQKIIQQITNQANTDIIKNEREHFIGDLSASMRLAAKPILDKYKEGNLYDKETGEKLPPATDEEAHNLSLLSKNREQILDSIANLPTDDAITKQREEIKDQYNVLQQKEKNIADKILKLQSWADERKEIAGELSPEFIKEFGRRSQELQNEKLQLDNEYGKLNKKVESFNKYIDNSIKSVDKNPTLKDRLERISEDSFLEMNYWQRRESQIKQAMENNDPNVSMSQYRDVLLHLQDAKAKFQAAALMLYKKEEPQQIKEKKGYYSEVFWRNAINALGLQGKAGQTLGGMMEPMKSEIIRKMDIIGKEAAIPWTKDEKKALSTNFAEALLAQAGGMLPLLPQLFVVGKVSELAQVASGLDRLGRAMKIIKNVSTGTASKILESDPIPIGWQLVKTIKPSNFARVFGAIGRTLIDEGVWAGLGGFPVGTTTGLSLSHLAFKNLKFNGKFQVLNPIIKAFVASGIGTTLGMEAGGTLSDALQSALNKIPLDEKLKERYPDVSTTTQRMLQMFIVNSFLFGGQTFFTEAAQKAVTAPIYSERTVRGKPMNWLVYISPKLRGEIYNAAQELESKGHSEAAKQLYQWLDITKEPITGEEVRKRTIENMEDNLSLLSPEEITEKEQEDKVILNNLLELQNTDKTWKGPKKVTGSDYKDLKVNDNVRTIDDGVVNVWRIIKKKYDKNEKIQRFDAINTYTGVIKKFDRKEDGTFDFLPKREFVVENPTELAQYLDAIYMELEAVRNVRRALGPVKPINLDNVSKIVDQELLDKKLLKIQKEKGLPSAPEINLSDLSKETLLMLNNKEPVTNDRLQQLIDEYYDAYKRLEVMPEISQRRFTTSQIKNFRKQLEEELFKLSEILDKQSKTGEFILPEPGKIKIGDTGLSDRVRKIQEEAKKAEEKNPINESNIGEEFNKRRTEYIKTKDRYNNLQELLSKYPGVEDHKVIYTINLLKDALKKDGSDKKQIENQLNTLIRLMDNPDKKMSAIFNDSVKEYNDAAARYSEIIKLQQDRVEKGREGENKAETLTEKPPEVPSPEKQPAGQPPEKPPTEQPPEKPPTETEKIAGKPEDAMNRKVKEFAKGVNELGKIMNETKKRLEIINNEEKRLKREKLEIQSRLRRERNAIPSAEQKNLRERIDRGIPKETAAILKERDDINVKRQEILDWDKVVTGKMEDYIRELLPDLTKEEVTKLRKRVEKNILEYKPEDGNKKVEDIFLNTITAEYENVKTPERQGAVQPIQSTTEEEKQGKIKTSEKEKEINKDEKRFREMIKDIPGVEFNSLWEDGSAEFRVNVGKEGEERWTGLTVPGDIQKDELVRKIEDVKKKFTETNNPPTKGKPEEKRLSTVQELKDRLKSEGFDMDKYEHIKDMFDAYAMFRKDDVPYWMIFDSLASGDYDKIANDLVRKRYSEGNIKDVMDIAEAFLGTPSPVVDTMKDQYERVKRTLKILTETKKHSEVDKRGSEIAKKYDIKYLPDESTLGNMVFIVGDVRLDFAPDTEDVVIDVAIRKAQEEQKFANETPTQKMRRLGYREIHGVRYERPEKVKNRSVGNTMSVFFKADESVDGLWVVMEADDVQPSHIRGSENPYYFIPEAQPRDRGSLADLKTQAEQKAKNLEPELMILGKSAFNGAPVVNERGEVIQGNGRAEALKYYYNEYKDDPRGYKETVQKYLTTLTGLSNKELEKYKNPVLVRMLSVDDADAIRLGNFESSEMEDTTGRGDKVKKLGNRMTDEQSKTLANIIFKGAESDDTLNTLIRKNEKEIFKYLTENKLMSDGDVEMYHINGDITPDGIGFIESFVKGMFFRGDMAAMKVIDSVPRRNIIRDGIFKAMPLLLSIDPEKSIIPSVRNAMVALYEWYSSTKGMESVENWANQTSLGFENNIRERFSDFELLLAQRLYDAKNISAIIRDFKKYIELINGKEKDLFEPAKPPVTRTEAVKEVWNVEYQKTIDDDYEENERKEGDTKGNIPDVPEREAKEKSVPLSEEEKTSITGKLSKIDYNNIYDLQKGIQPQDNDVREGLVLDFVNYISRLRDEADKTSFDDLMSSVLENFTERETTMMLPFIRQAYFNLATNGKIDVSNEQIVRAGSFDVSDIDKILAKKYEQDQKKYSDIVGKEIYIPETNSTYDVLRVELWKHPQDKHYEELGGLFSVLADRFDPVEVAVISIDPVTGEKKAVPVNQLRSLIKSGKVIVNKEYVNPKYQQEMDRIADEYLKMGDEDAENYIRRKSKRNPDKIKNTADKSKENYTWQDEVNVQQEILKRKKRAYAIENGMIMFDSVEPEVWERSTLYDRVEALVRRGGPLTPYLAKYLPVELKVRIIEHNNEVFKIAAELGLKEDDLRDVPYLRKFYGGVVLPSLVRFGRIAKDYEEGKRGITEERLKKERKYVEKVLEDEQKNLEKKRLHAFLWEVKNRLWNNQNFERFPDLMKVAEKWGIKNKIKVKEYAERAAIEVAKATINNKTLTDIQRFNAIRDIYDQLPSFDSAQSGQSKVLQQFSTPLPLAYLMDMYVNADQVDYVLEPSAGNGALLMGARRTSVRAVELDATRYENLIDQGYLTVNEDSRNGVRGLFDIDKFPAIVMNPPFGGEKEKYAGYPMTGTQAIVAKTLESLSETGKAAFIIGGRVELDQFGLPKGINKTFFNWLSTNFYIDGVFRLNRDVFHKSGANIETTLVLINGRRPVRGNAVLYGEEKFPEAKSISELFDMVNKIKTKPDARNILQTKLDANRGSDHLVGSTSIPNAENKTTERPSSIRTGENNEVIGEGQFRGEGESILSGNGEISDRNFRRTGRPNNDKPGISEPISTPPTESQYTHGFFDEPNDDAGKEDLPVRNIGKPDERTVKQLDIKERELDNVTKYVPLSKMGSGNYTIPVSIALEVQSALEQLQYEVGDVDNYVADKLNFPSVEHLRRALFAEQVDGVAQSIYNIEMGDAMIIGHQTGAGKGRIAASIIRYARENGKIPVFFTKSADLFNDIYRDMYGILTPNYKPFIINRSFGKEGTVKIFNPESGDLMFQSDQTAINKALDTGKLPEDIDFVMTTYSQFNTSGRDDIKRDFLHKLADDNNVIFIMDESHEVAGDKSAVGKFFREWLRKTEGGLFLSATYAKRPENLPLYAIKTVLNETNLSDDELVDSIRRGGTALQEIITLQLAQAGQFSRLGFKIDSKINYRMLGENDPKLEKEIKDKYDKATRFLQRIANFQKDFVNPVLKRINNEIRKKGSSVKKTEGTSKLGIKNTPYLSRVWQIIDQMLFAIKVNHIIGMVANDLKENRKPVIALSSTMESLFDEMLDEMGFKKGDEIPMDFSYVFKRGLKTAMKYTETDAQGNKVVKVLQPEDLTEEGRREYFNLLDGIKNTITDIPLSPIDVLRKRIKDMGYDVVEITGRRTMIDLSDDMRTGIIKNNDRGNKIDEVKYFNNNKGVVAIINRSGSTGISMHSDVKFGDTSQRVMYPIQNDYDINTVIQKFGRVNRVGQVVPPEYNFVITPVPAEVRNMMMLARKLKSLDANTSGDQKINKDFMDVPDYMNKYGDQVVVEYLRENPDINAMIGDPLHLTDENDTYINAAHKVTGRMQLVPVDIQEKFNNEIVDRYNNLIEYLNATGQNDLAVTYEDLNATSKNSEITIFGNGGYSVFGQDTRLETVEADITKKPVTKKEVDNMLDSVPKNHIEALKSDMSNSIERRMVDEIGEIRKRYDKQRLNLRNKIWSKEKLSEEEKNLLYDSEVESVNQMELSRIQIIKSLADRNKLLFTRMLDFFYPGRVLKIPFNENDNQLSLSNNLGVFIGFDVNMNKKYPWVPSNVMLRFATNDSRRVFRLPTSKIDHLESIIENSSGISDYEQKRMFDEWDKNLSGKKRNVRFIVTGNILQAMNLYKTGRLIQFTRDDHTTDKGILLPENFVKPDLKVARIPIIKSLDIIRGLNIGDYIEDSSGNITFKRIIWNGDPNYYEFMVPASSRGGSKFIKNPEIRDLLTDDFIKKGNRMVSTIDDVNLPSLLELLHNQFKLTLDADYEKVGKSMNQTRSQGMMSDFGLTNPQPERKSEGSHNQILEYSESVTGKEERIGWDGIPGEEPKQLFEIVGELSKKLGKQIQFKKQISRRNFAGGYDSSVGTISVKSGYRSSLDVISHEIGHYLDDRFGILKPSPDIWRMSLRGELSKLWIYGSKPYKDMTEAEKEQYRMAEGMAEFIRAFIVNPNETMRRFPVIYDLFKKKVPEDIMKTIGDFSREIRILKASTARSRMITNLKLDTYKKEKMALFGNTDSDGNYRYTMYDEVSHQIWYFMQPIKSAFEWAMKQNMDFTQTNKKDEGKPITNIMDPSQLSPVQNAEIMLRKQLGLNVKLNNMHERGLKSFDGRPLRDPKNGHKLTWNYLMSRIPSDHYDDYEDNVKFAMSIGIAQRTVEIVDKKQRWMMRHDLKNLKDMLPPMDLLRKHPDIYDEYENKIEETLNKISSGELDPKEVFLPEDRYDFRTSKITGVAQEGETDYELAKITLDSFEKLKNSDPDKYKWVNEFWRVYRLMGRNWVDYAKDSGLINEKSANYIKNENLFYVGFQRVQEWEAKDIIEGKDEVSNIFRTPGSGGFLPSRGVKKAVHAVFGSDLPMGNPVENLIESWNRIVESGDTNFAVFTFARAFMQKEREMYNGDIPKLGDVAYVSSTREPHSIQFWMGGTKQFLVFRNKELFNVWRDLLPSHEGKKNYAATILQNIASTARKSVIVAIPFVVRNVLRDTQQFLVVGEGLKYFFKKVDKPGGVSWNDLFETYGGGQFGFVYRNREAYNHLMKKIIFDSIHDPKKYFANPLKLVKKISKSAFGWIEMSERPVRLVQFISAYKQGILKYHLSHSEAAIRAAYIARDLMDFAATGNTVKELNKYMIFTGAAVRGVEKVTRRSGEAPGVTFLRFMAGPVMAGLMNSFLIYQLGNDKIKKEYLSRPDYRRDMFYFVPLGNTGVNLIIPKPFEIGMLSSIAQRMGDYYFLNDDRAFSSNWIKDFWHLAFPYDIPGMTGGFAGFIALATNRDLFRQKYIIPPDEKDEAIVARNTERASHFGQLIQRLSDLATPRKKNNPLIDARMVDAFISKQLPYYGDYLLKLFELLVPKKERNRRYTFNLRDTGMFTVAPGYNAPTVQWVHKTWKLYAKGIKGKFGNQFYRDVLLQLNMLESRYFSDEVQADPKKIAVAGERLVNLCDELYESMKDIDLNTITANKAKIDKIKRKFYTR